MELTIDPKEPGVEIDLEGRRLRVCFDFNALVLFQRERKKNIVQAFRQLDIKRLAELQAPLPPPDEPEAGKVLMDEQLAEQIQKLEAEREAQGWALLEQLDFEDLRAAWWASLQRYHAGISIDAAGRLLHQGNVLRVASKLGGILGGSFPDSEEVGDGPASSGESTPTGSD